MSAVAAIALFTGASIAGIWTWTLLSGGSPEVREGRRSIRFHVAAEYLIAAMLVAGGVAVLLGGGAPARTLVAAGLGGALYSTINSPGYYADLGQRAAVRMFVILAAVLAAAIGLLAASA